MNTGYYGEKTKGQIRIPRDVSLFGDIASFLIPALMFLEINIGGRLFISEIIGCALLPFLIILKGSRLWKPRLFLLLIFLWLGGLIASDLIRDSTFVDYSRGWAKVTLFAINFTVIYLLLYQNRKRWILFGYGLAIGMLLDYFVSPSEYAEYYPWKFGFGVSVTYLIVLLSTKKIVLRFIAPEIMMGLAAILNIILGFRSLGLICGLSMLFLILQRHNKAVSIDGYRKLLKFLPLLLVIVVGAFGILKLYSYSASSGILGEQQQQKYMAQSSGEWGILLGGRSELFASGQAIMDSPFIGYGSWARNSYYADLVSIRRSELGYEVSGADYNDTIPTHSYLFGAWVEAGFLGGLFWVACLWVVSKVLVMSLLLDGRLYPWLIFCLLLLSWDILFSPLGAQQRMVAAYQLAIVLSLYYSKYRNKINFNKY